MKDIESTNLLFTCLVFFLIGIILMGLRDYWIAKKNKPLPIIKIVTFYGTLTDVTPLMLNWQRNMHPTIIKTIYIIDPDNKPGSYTYWYLIIEYHVQNI